MPAFSGKPVVTYSCAFCFRTRGCGCIGTRHSLRPLPFEGGSFVENSGASCREKAKLCLECRTTTLVITGLVPVIHVFLSSSVNKNVDGRDKPGHDDEYTMRR